MEEANAKYLCTPMFRDADHLDPDDSVALYRVKSKVPTARSTALQKDGSISRNISLVPSRYLCTLLKKKTEKRSY